MDPITQQKIQAAQAAGVPDQYIQQRWGSSAAQPSTPAPSGGGGIWPLLGSIGGGLLGLPFGPAGVIGGGALGGGIASALSGGGPGEIAKQAALGGAGGLLPELKLGKLLGIGGRAAEDVAGQAATQTADRAGSGLAAKTLASNFTVPTKAGRAGINIEDALRQAIQDKTIPGPINMQGYKNLAGDITGANGAVTKGLQFASNNIKSPIDFGTPLVDAQKSLTTSGLSKGAQQDAMDTANAFFPKERQMTGSIQPIPGESPSRVFVGNPPGGEAPGLGTTMPGGGGLGGMVPPNSMSATDAHDVMRQLEEKGYGMIHAYGPKALTPNPEKAAVGDMLVGISQDLGTQIDKAAQNEMAIHAQTGQTGILLDHVKQQIVDQLAGKYPGVVAKVQQAKSLAEIRSVAAPYVNIGKAADSTIIAHQAPLNRVGSNMSLGLGGAGAGFGIGGPVGAGIGMMAAPALAGAAQAAQPALTSLAARGILGGAQALGKAGPVIAGQAGSHLLGDVVSPQTAQAAELPGQTAQDQLASPDNQNVTAQDTLREKLGAYLLSHARNTNDIMQGYSLLYPKPVPGQLTVQERNTLNTNLDKFSQIYKQMGPIQRLNPYDPQNRQLQTIKTLMIAQVRKAMVGGRATQQELTWIMNLLPPLNHPSAVIYPGPTVDAAVNQLKSSLGVDAPIQNEMPLPSSGFGQ